MGSTGSKMHGNRHPVQMAEGLPYRRLRALADYENANKAMDKARTRTGKCKQQRATNSCIVSAWSGFCQAR